MQISDLNEANLPLPNIVNAIKNTLQQQNVVRSQEFIANTLVLILQAIQNNGTGGNAATTYNKTNLQKTTSDGDKVEIAAHTAHRIMVPLQKGAYYLQIGGGNQVFVLSGETALDLTFTTTNDDNIKITQDGQNPLLVFTIEP